jgi:hypothetical protein
MYLPSSAVDILNENNYERELCCNFQRIQNNSLQHINVINNSKLSINVLGILLDAIDRIERCDNNR